MQKMCKFGASVFPKTQDDILKHLILSTKQIFSVYNYKVVKKPSKDELRGHTATEPIVGNH